MTNFWTAQEHIPSEMGFALFGLTHLFWLGSILMICMVGIGLFRWLSSAQKRKVLRVLAYVMLGMELCKDAMLIRTGQFRPGYLPLDLCGISIFLELAAVTFPKPLLTELVYSFSLPGAALALLFPNWNSLPQWNYMNLHSFFLHAILLLIPVLLLASGMMRPSASRLPFCLICMIGACVPITWVNRYFGTNFFFLERPSKGSPLVWFEQTFGSHLIGFPVLIALIWAGMYGIPVLLSKLPFLKKDDRQIP